MTGGDRVVCQLVWRGDDSDLSMGFVLAFAQKPGRRR